MPRRTEAISKRDVAVLGLIARLGVSPRSVVMAWAGMSDRSSAYRRERRLLEAGFLEQHPPFAASGPVFSVTWRGLRACGRDDLPEPRYSHGQVVHSLEVGTIGVAYELAGQSVLFEREITAAERSYRERMYSAELGGRRFHRPDLVLVGEKPVAVEVELTQKSGARLDEILRAWRDAVLLKKVGQVVYRCGEKARSPVERAMARTKITNGKHIRLENL